MNKKTTRRRICIFKIATVLLILLGFESVSIAQTAFNPKKIAPGKLPANLPFNGKMEDAWQWKDKLGDNVLILSNSLSYPDKSNDNDQGLNTVELFVYHYVKKDSSYRRLWQLNDIERKCEMDITGSFIDAATTITDLDKDGIAETTVMYRLACRSDVSPATTKLIMHEDTVKYALRGLSWVKGSEDDKFAVTENDVNLDKLPKKDDEYDQLLQAMGRYQNEKDFIKAPPSLLQFARKQWLKYVKESFE